MNIPPSGDGGYGQLHEYFPAHPGNTLCLKLERHPHDMIAPCHTDEYRYERKFHITELDRWAIESIVKSHPALFREVYHRRWINSIYFDNWKMTSYNETQVGSSHNRIKYRVRWYGDQLGTIESPTLELKIKDGDVGRKEFYPLRPFNVNEVVSADALHDVFRDADLPPQLLDDLLGMGPVLLNRYSRNYFISADGHFRITLDSEIGGCDPRDATDDSVRRWVDPLSIVLEVKYSPSVAPDAHRISQYFPFRVTRNSKYCGGVEQIHSHL